MTKNSVKLYINSGSYKEYMKGFKTTSPDNYDRQDFLSMKKALIAFKNEVKDIQDGNADKEISYKVVDGSLYIFVEKEMFYCLWINGFRNYRNKQSRKRFLNEYNNILNSCVE